jgi:hypothetical protein
MVALRDALGGADADLYFSIATPRAPLKRWIRIRQASHLMVVGLEVRLAKGHPEIDMWYTCMLRRLVI